MAKGFVAGGVDTAAGLYHVAANPLQTGAALGQAIRHPVRTAQVAWGAAQAMARAMAAGDPDAVGRGLDSAR